MRPSSTVHQSNDHARDTYDANAGMGNTPTDMPANGPTIGEPPAHTHSQSATSLTSRAHIATPSHDPWLVRFAEPRTANIRWWTLVVGVLSIGLGVLASFGYLLTNTIWPNIALGLLTWVFLIIGVSSMARFVLDVIVTQRAGRHVRQRLTQHVV